MISVSRTRTNITEMTVVVVLSGFKKLLVVVACHRSPHAVNIKPILRVVSE